MRRIVVAALTVLVSGCVTGPKYAEPRGLIEANSVVIKRWSVGPTCRWHGIEGSDGQRACEAHVINIDGLHAPRRVDTRLALGTHTLVLACFFGTPPATIRWPTGASVVGYKMYSDRYRVRFDSDARYRLESYWQQDRCRVRMVDEASGAELQLEPLPR